MKQLFLLMADMTRLASSTNGRIESEANVGSLNRGLVEIETIDESEISIESFQDPKLAWVSMNDPVMGGKSIGSFNVNQELGVFQGKVVNVPFLEAPGFIKIDGKGDFPDVSSCTALKMTVMAKKRYKGYRVSFGVKHAPHTFMYTHGFKAHFNPPVGKFGDVVISFDEFSDNWSAYTGDQVVSCKDNAEFCPDAATLENMKELSIWGEGIAGKVDLRIKSISAIGCNNEERLESGRDDVVLSETDPQMKTIAYGGVILAIVVTAASLLTLRSYRKRSSSYHQIGDAVEINV